MTRRLSIILLGFALLGGFVVGRVAGELGWGDAGRTALMAALLFVLLLVALGRERAGSGRR